MFLTLLPALVIARIEGLFGLHSSRLLLVRTQPQHEGFADAIVAVGLYSAALVVTSVTIFLCVSEDTVLSGHPWLAAGASGLLLASLLATRLVTPLAHDHPKTCLALTLITMLGLAASFGLIMGTAALKRSLWFYGTLLGMQWVRRTANKPFGFRKLDIERWIGYPAVFLLTFALFVYGTVKPEFGGGSPAPALIYLTSDAAKLMGSEQLRVWLIDQTDYGYYTLRKRDAKAAMLLPRTSIRAIEFDATFPKKQQDQKKPTEPTATENKTVPQNATTSPTHPDPK